MKHSGYILLLLTSFFAVSCHHTSIIDGAEARLVSPEKIVSISCDTAFHCTFPEVLNCCGIQIVNDTVLVLQDQVNEANPYHFKAYSTNTFEYMGSFVRNGRGPGEIIHPHIAKSNALKKYLNVNVNQEGKAYLLDVDESIKSRKAAIYRSFALPPGIIDWLPLSDTKQFVLRQDSGKLLFQIIDDDKAVSGFNLNGNIAGEQYITHLSSILVNDGYNGRVAECMIFLPQLNIFDTERGQVYSITVDKAYRKWESVLNSMISPDTIQYYDSATSTSEYIFATYKDVPLSKLNESGQGTCIHIFDWDGNFLYEISVKENIDNIMYDAWTGYLYCHEKTNGGIIRYDLDGLFNVR